MKEHYALKKYFAGCQRHGTVEEILSGPFRAADYFEFRGECDVHRGIGAAGEEDLAAVD